MHEGSTQTTPQETKSKKKLWVWIVGIVTVLVVIGALSKKDPDRSRDTEQVAVSETTSDESSEEVAGDSNDDTEQVEDEVVEETPVENSGLGLSTSDVRNVFARHGMPTSKGQPADGLDNWTGSAQQVVGQILANGDVVESVQLVIVFEPQDPSSLKADVAGRILKDLDPKTSSAAQRLLAANDFGSDWKDAIVVSNGMLRGSYTRVDASVAALTFILE